MSETNAPKTVAILTAGGLAPCLSSAVGYLIELYTQRMPSTRIICYRSGYKGLLLGDFIEVSPTIRAECGTLHAHGGSPIGNSRVKLTNVKDCVKRGLVKEGENPQKVAADQLVKDGVEVLHTIGGDDTSLAAAALSAFLATNGYNLTVIGLPKTIDNDVVPVKQSLGAATAADHGAAFFANVVAESTANPYARGGAARAAARASRERRRTGCNGAIPGLTRARLLDGGRSVHARACAWRCLVARAHSAGRGRGWRTRRRERAEAPNEITRARDSCAARALPAVHARPSPCVRASPPPPPNPNLLPHSLRSLSERAPALRRRLVRLARRMFIVHEVMGRDCGWLTAATARDYTTKVPAAPVFRRPLARASPVAARSGALCVHPPIRPPAIVLRAHACARAPNRARRLVCPSRT